MLPYGRQSVSEADIEAVVRVLRSDFLTQGPMVPAFEEALASRCGAAHAVAVSNATSALHLACLSLDVGAGDEVWTSPNTFVASANCALYCGASVDFVDIDRATGNLDVAALEEKLKSAATRNQLPKVLIVVHFAGEPCDMSEIARLSEAYGFAVIEDASHAVGAEYKQKPVGSAELSDAVVFSFHPVKVITTGEGGMVTTRSSAIADRLRLLRSHGVTKDPDLMTRTSEGSWYYEQIALGFNYRMTDIQAALGLSQLQRLDGFISRRHELAGRYDKLLEALQVQPLLRRADSRSSLHLYVIRLDSANGTAGRNTVFEKMRSEGIGVQIHYIPVHTQPFYRKLGFKQGDFPEAERFYSEAISLPLFPDLEGRDQDRVCEILGEAITQASTGNE